MSFLLNEVTRASSRLLPLQPQPQEFAGDSITLTIRRRGGPFFSKGALPPSYWVVKSELLVVVGGFHGHGDVVRVRFLQAGSRDAHELAAGLELGNGRRANVEH